MRDWQVAVVLGLLVAVNLGVNIVFGPLGSNAPHEFLSFGILGATFGQPMLLAIWAVLAPQRWSDRLPLAMLLAGAVACSHALAALLDGGTVERVAWLRGIALLTVFCLACAAAWLIAPRFHWRMWRSNGGPMQYVVDGHAAGQFTVRGLLLWVTLAAALLAVAVRVFPSAEVIADDSGLGWAVLNDVLSVLSELDQPPFILLFIVAFVFLQLALAHRRWAVPVSVIVLAACSAGTVALFYMEDDWGSSGWYEIGLILLALACIMIVSLLIVRACGFRIAISKRDEAWLAVQWANQPAEHGSAGGFPSSQVGVELAVCAFGGGPAGGAHNIGVASCRKCAGLDRSLAPKRLVENWFEGNLRRRPTGSTGLGIVPRRRQPPTEALPMDGKGGIDAGPTCADPPGRISC